LLHRLNFVKLSVFIIFLAIAKGQKTGTPTNIPVPCGGCYETLPTTQTDVINAAKFAASKLSPKYNSVIVETAEGQLVSGYNYKMKINIKSETGCLAKPKPSTLKVSLPAANAEFNKLRKLVETDGKKCQCHSVYIVVVYKPFDSDYKLTSASLSSTYCAR